MGWNLGTSNPNEVGVTWNQGNPIGNVPDTFRERDYWEEMMAQRAAQMRGPLAGPVMTPRDLGLSAGQAIPQQGSQGGAPVGGYDPTVPGVNYTFPGVF